jgi:hypothetical protein
MPADSLEIFIKEALLPSNQSKGCKSMITLAPSPFEVWARDNGYDTARAVVPAHDRRYANRDTQAVFDAWDAGCRYVAMILTESTLETEALRERIRMLAGVK